MPQFERAELEKKFHEAVEFLKSSQLAESETQLRSILQVEPEHAGSLYYLGLIAKMTGHLDAAYELNAKLISLHPDNPRGHHSQGAVLKALGRLEEAAACFHNAIKKQPDYPVAYNNLGNTLQELKQYPAAEKSYRKALELAPDQPTTHNNLGVVLRELGRMDEAIDCFRRGLELNPEYVEAHNNIGIAMLSRGELEKALSHLQKAMLSNPGSNDVLNNLGVCYRRLDRLTEAAECFEKSLKIQPDNVSSLDGLGVVMHRQGELTEAVRLFEKALSLQPDYAESHNNLGNVLFEQGRQDEALKAYRRAVDSRQDYAEAENNIGVTLLQMNHVEEAVGHYKRALALDSGFAEAMNNLGNAHVLLGKPAEAVEYYRLAIGINPDYADAGSNLIFALDIDPDIDAETFLQERLEWNERHVKPLASERFPLENKKDPGRILKIGYVSADFRRHSAAYLFAPVLLEYNRFEFEVFCYSNSPKKDDYTDMFRKSVTGWRDVYGLLDSELAEQIREDGIDILVDLAGHTQGNRLLTFARKPAPVQVSAWGNATGTGLETMDYLFSDAVSVPDEWRRYYTEELYDLPCNLGYVCPTEAPQVAPGKAAETGAVTYGCFNRLEKITAPVLDLWAKILQAAPGAGLVLKDKTLSQESYRTRMLDAFSQRGVNPERIELLGHTSWFDHLKAYGEMDIALDPFPMNGGTTTLEGLWMGVPVVTLQGETPNSRGTASILTAIGLEDWIAQSSESYLDTALNKGSKLDGLADVRKTLRERLATSPVGHAPTYVGAVEQAYRTFWNRWCAN